MARYKVEVVPWRNRKAVEEVLRRGTVVAVSNVAATSSQKGATFITREALLWTGKQWLIASLPKFDFAQNRDGGGRNLPEFKEVSPLRALWWAEGSTEVEAPPRLQNASPISYPVLIPYFHAEMFRNGGEDVYEAIKESLAQYDPRVLGAKAQAEAEAMAKAQAEAEARAKAKAEAEAMAKAQAEAEAMAKAQAEAEARAKAKAEAEAMAKAQAEAEARVSAEEAETAPILIRAQALIAKLGGEIPQAMALSRARAWRSMEKELESLNARFSGYVSDKGLPIVLVNYGDGWRVRELSLDSPCLSYRKRTNFRWTEKIDPTSIVEAMEENGALYGSILKDASLAGKPARI